jgi:23S rRNA maturation-related 3'-5' exoribonuclease YhaM
MQHSRARPSVPKAIVPAIPLPYIQKRKQQLVAREKAREDEKSAPTIEQSSPPTVTEPVVANGSSVEHGDNNLNEVNKEASNASEHSLPVVNFSGEETRENASEESMAQAHGKITGMMDSPRLKYLLS